jgi:hypothetical protein
MMTCIFGLISPSTSSPWLTRAVVFSLAASIGGMFVFWGLWKEKMADKKEYIDVEDFRSSKLKAKRGWIILMIGISIEILTGAVLTGYSVWENVQTTSQMAKNDPRNQPISVLSAFANFVVKGTNENRTPEMVKWQTGMVAILMLYESGDSKTSSSSPFDLLEADGFLLGNNGHFPDARMYFMKFQQNLFAASSNIGRGKMTAKKIDDVKFVGVGLNFLPPGAEILDGSVEIIVNSSLSKVFQILPQKDSDPEDGKFARPYWIFATNTLPANIIQKEGK